MEHLRQNFKLILDNGDGLLYFLKLIILEVGVLLRARFIFFLMPM
jgi:hypothetical protein